MSDRTLPIDRAPRARAVQPQLSIAHLRRQVAIANLRSAEAALELARRDAHQAQQDFVRLRDAEMARLGISDPNFGWVLDSGELVQEAVRGEH